MDTTVGVEGVGASATAGSGEVGHAIPAPSPSESIPPAADMRRERAATEAPSRARARVYWLLATAYVALIFGMPIFAVATLLAAVPGPLALAVGAFLGPLAFTAVYAGVAGTLALPHRRWIVPGTWPTDLGLRPYFHRRLYGLCWTSLYYNVPVYWAVLSFPCLRNAVFRLFGYRGALRFTVYPDTWIRDLPLLDIGDGAYLSNRATVGTNIILASRHILVDRVTIGPRATLGHLACIGPGVTVGDRADIGPGALLAPRCVIASDSHVGAGAMIGLGCRVGAETRVAPGCIIEHGVRVGAGAVLHIGCRVASASFIADGLHLPVGSVLPPRTRLRSQADLASLAGARGPCGTRPGGPAATS